jgi:1,2-diacylglycerol 3-beta-galactosyltransferase
MGGMRKKIFLMITDAGGGHRSTALSLQNAAARQGLPWDLRIVNLYREVWKEVDLGQALFNLPGEELYNLALKTDFISATTLMHHTASWFIRLRHSLAVKVTREFFQHEQPDLVLSLMPFVNDVLAEALEGTGVPLGLLVTDLQDTPAGGWFTPRACRSARFIAVGSAPAARQARAVGASEARLLHCGLVIHPKYFDPQVRSLPQTLARTALGLNRDPFTPMLMMGAWAGRALGTFIRQFERSRRPWQILACCGRNAALKRSLEKLAPKLKNTLVPVGYSENLHLAMRAADVCITKPGPASITEALAMGLPLVLDDSATMVQERPNAAWVRAQGLGLVLRRRGDMLAVLEHLQQDPRTLASLRERLQSRPPANAAPVLLQQVSRALEERAAA